MAFNSFAEFIAMGGHAPYVWSSWGLTLFLLVVLVWHARFERRQLINSLKRRERRERARKQQNAAPAPLQPVVAGGQHDT
ncbi:heme exporter protein CcmD [Halomonas llamarensis]|uniref:Heme exporter protein D n=1 Tax=Halomonas llamarensis TaxID=2945104 RepID=A0ABT0SQW9_9GAMM|nr:heme exporter protein CcmD [Halomonas llamarensis]MCL7930224.1 heme exporter protein CcmD [Halomonas llamarensis]